MKTSILFVAALTLAATGCKKKAAEGADCTKAITNSMALSKADMEKMPGMNAKMLQTMKDVGIERCNGDKWPADAIKCMTDAKTMGAAQECYGKLSQDQQDKMNKAAMESVMGAGGGSAEPGTAGSAGGSEGSGSAAAGSGSAGSAAETGSGSAGSAAAAGSAGSAAAGSGSGSSGSAATK